MMTIRSDEALRALAAAVKEVRTPTPAAWAQVRAALAKPAPPAIAARRLALRPMMASMSVVAAFFVFSQVGLIRALADPTVTAGIVPGPRVSVGTPVAGLMLPAATATPQPAAANGAALIPLPPLR